MIHSTMRLYCFLCMMITFLEAFRPSGQIRHRHKNFMVTDVRPPTTSKNSHGPKINMAAGRLSQPVVKIPVASHEHDWQVLPDIWDTLSRIIPNKSMLVDPVHGDRVDLTYSQVNNLITQGAASLQSLGINSGDCVSIFSENSHKWLVAEQAVMKAGGCNAVRGALAPVEELQYIYDNSESKGAVIENPNLLKSLYNAGGLFSGKHGAPKFVVVLYSRDMSSAELTEMAGSPTGTQIMTYEDFLDLSTPNKFQSVSRDKQAPATLVYTSGTTSNPKGVVLNHENLLHQVFKNSFNRNRNNKYDPWVGDVFVSILPCWHIFERTAEYFCLSRGAQMVYSNLRNFKNDLTVWKPHFLIAVPRLFENIYKGIQANVKSMSPAKRKLVGIFTSITQIYIHCKRTWTNLLVRNNKPNLFERLIFLIVSTLLWPLHKIGDTLVWKKIRGNMGGRLKTMISGGSSIPQHIESFFDMAGINLIVGYGLTETSPVICNRVAEHNIMGTVGCPPPGTELKIVDVDTRKEVKRGQPGVVLARGPGIMKGYKNNLEATNAAIDKDGFFDTGDLGRINPATGDFIITGRAKDTIVLSNGENVEPQTIEEAMTAHSPFIEQAMLVGQDSAYLGAVVVVSVPELVKEGFLSAEKGKMLDKILGPTPTSTGPAGDVEVLRQEAASLRENPKFKEAIMADISRITGQFRPWERVGTAHVVLEPFSVANGQATMTLKIKRHIVTKDYESDIAAFYKKK
jgi:long-chain acyl-CoA synthetase